MTEATNGGIEMTEKKTIADVMEKWRKFFIMTLAGHDSFLDEVEGAKIPNTPTNRTVFSLLPETHRRHDIEYTVDDSGHRKICASVMMVTPEVGKMHEEGVFEDVMKEITDTEKANPGAFHHLTTMQLAKQTAEALSKHFGDDAKDSIKKINKLMDEIEKEEKRLAEKGEDWDSKAPSDDSDDDE